MNKNTLCSCTFAALCLAVQVMAQTSSTAPVKTTVSKTKKIEVKDYKSFKEYVAESSATKYPAAIASDAVKKKLIDMGITFQAGRTYGVAKDRRRVAYQTKNQKGVIVIDRELKQALLYNADGQQLKTVLFSEPPKGTMDFSDDAIFEINACFREEPGFKIFNLQGELVKTVNGECVENHAISNGGKHFVVIAGDKQGHWFTIYDKVGNALYRQKIDYGDAEIIFSRDDKYVLVKIPVYWEDGEQEVLKRKKMYLIDVMRRGLITDGNYEE